MEQSFFKEQLNKININVDADKLNKLENYYNLLKEWNEKQDLTNIIEKQDVYLKHFYDSLTVNKIIDLTKINTLCDIGSGAGLPGVVLKIIFPHLKVTLVDSLTKRITFLEAVKKELGLKDLIIVNARIEEYALKTREEYEIVTARAVAPLNILAELSLPLVKENGYFIAMKGSKKDEIQAALNGIKILGGVMDGIEEFKLPIENSDRMLIKIKKIKQTNKKYPRKFNQIKQKPL